jgi:hypothetical protein
MKMYTQVYNVIEECTANIIETVQVIEENEVSPVRERTEESRKE